MKKISNKRIMVWVLAGIILVLFVATIAGLIYYEKMIKELGAAEEVVAERYPRLYAYIADDPESKLSNSIYKEISEYAKNNGCYVEMTGQNLSTSYSKTDRINIAISSKVDGIILEGDRSNETLALIDKAAEVAKESIDLEKLREIADYHCNKNDLQKKDISDQDKKILKDADNIKSLGVKRKRIAVARDEAFSFYYEENLDILRKYFDLIFFSPIRDKKLPEDISGLIIGGGYPEEYAKELSSNKSMKESIFKALKRGMPVIAECGGFMYLSKTLTTKDGKCHEMTGYIDSNISYMGKLVRFGYCEIEDKATGIKIRGHEFHYFDSDNNGDGCIMTKKTVDKSWQGIHRKGAQWIGYPHLYLPSSEEFINWFVFQVMNYPDKLKVKD